MVDRDWNKGGKEVYTSIIDEYYVFCILFGFGWTIHQHSESRLS